MTSVKRISFIWWLVAALLLSSLLAFKPLDKKQDVKEAGVYVVGNSRMFDKDSQFDLKDKLVFVDNASNTVDVSINQSNKALTIGHDDRAGRCNRCHECGFDRAWDAEHYGTDQWNPVYVGDEWAPSVARMRKLENSFINEQIGDRIFTFLRDETLGVYDESADPGRVVETNPNDLKRDERNR